MPSLIAAGLSNSEIAARTFLSINPVKTRIRTCYRKVGVTSRSQAVNPALQEGLGHDADVRPRSGLTGDAAVVDPSTPL